jgi:hypothetical protein
MSRASGPNRHVPRESAKTTTRIAENLPTSPVPDSDSQSNSDLRKITRNVSLTLATFGDTGQRRRQWPEMIMRRWASKLE